MASKTQQLWSRLAGLFGADALSRKFGDSPPEEWIAVVERMNDYQLARGMRRLIHGGRDGVPTLPAFVKLCEDPGGVGEFNEGPRPSVVQIEDTREWDIWLTQGNRHLLNYIREFTPRHPRRYAGAKETEVLVSHKNAWVRDMQDAAGDEGVPIDAGKAWWQDSMRKAEIGIDAITQAEAA